MSEIWHLKDDEESANVSNASSYRAVLDDCDELINIEHENMHCNCYRKPKEIIKKVRMRH